MSTTGNDSSSDARYFRKVIRIKADDSPNVRLAMAEIATGRKPSNRILVPGVLSYTDYRERRLLWDKVRQCIGLDAEFWEGAEVLLFPPEWLNLSEQADRTITTRVRKREARAIGIDPAEGGDDTAMAAVDEHGVIDVVSRKTPNTAVIRGEAIAFGRKYNVPPSAWMFDRGGGGKQIADDLRQDGFMVRTVGFGESITAEIKSGLTTRNERRELAEERYAYKNRRAQMYGELSELMDPAINDYPFAIPSEFSELRRQLGPVPKLYNKEGQLYLPPKRKQPGAPAHVVSLEEIIGCSPDQADAVVMAVHCMLHRGRVMSAGSL